MADRYWISLAERSAERFKSVVEETKQFYMEAFEQLTLMGKPAERQAAYSAMDFSALRELDPDLWKKLSQDALTLEERERNKRLEELKAFENEQYTFANAFRPQVSPYGYTPNNATSSELGLNQAIPLGRFG